MNPIDFLKTIYLGDRAIKAISVDSWARIVKIQVDTISRVRSLNGRWDFYSAEDIVDGALVFDGVRSFEITPPGAIPDDHISDVRITSQGDFFLFEISSSDSDQPNIGNVIVRMVAEGFSLEDPKRPDEKISE
ncbi:DUF6258 family protein [Andreprevotia chitinilytica]|uniref:DUF6258 family protein n=1 Tax=Andreprevotia chitinilytica TaxID=396808 RepID=UPI0005527F86|nr:DUF6258 family protein [Andreprevotia chitinilytica]